MKMFIGAIALAISTPVMAQKNTVADIPHGQAADHSQHERVGEHDCKACCEKMKSKNDKMDCMDNKVGSHAPAPSQSSNAPASHAGHAQ